MRVVSWNILACRGWRPGEHPVDAPGPARPEIAPAVGDALAGFDADVIALQECPAEEIVAGFAARLGMRMAWFPGRWAGNDDWPGGFPGALCARGSMVDPRDEVGARDDLPAELFQRHWGSARVACGRGRLTVHAYHLCASFADRSNEETRDAELAAVVAAIPEGEPAVLLGDHNTRPGERPLSRLEAGGFVDAHIVAGTGDGFTDPAIAPRQRIDQCWVRGIGVAACRVATGPQFGDDPEAVVLSDHRPLIVDLEP